MRDYGFEAVPDYPPPREEISLFFWSDEYRDSKLDFTYKILSPSVSAAAKSLDTR